MKILALLGRSGVGKTRMYRRLRDEISDLVNPVPSITTRPIREGERNGDEYKFISIQEFEERIKKNDFIEYVEYRGNYYGKSLSEFSEENVNVLVIEPVGLKQLKERLEGRAKIISLMIHEPDEVILERLSRRDNHSGIEKRFEFDKEYFKDIKGDINVDSDFDDLEELIEYINND